MPLYTNLSHRIDGYLREFCQQIHERHPEVLTEDLLSLWQTITKPKKRTTRYHQFFRQERSKILRENPKASFGEISRQCSHRWKSLSQEERLVFPQIVTTQNQEDHKSTPLSSPSSSKSPVLSSRPHTPPFEVRKKKVQEKRRKEFLEKYRAKSFQEVYKIAKNWFEDEGVVDIRPDMSKDEMIQHLMSAMFDVPPVEYPVDHPVWKEHIGKSLQEIQDLVCEERPWYNNKPQEDQLKEDLLYLLVKLEDEKKALPPIEVHPFYYELRAKPMNYLYELCERTFGKWNPKIDWRSSSMDRKKLTRVLVRNFDDVVFPEEEEEQEQQQTVPEETKTRRRKKDGSSQDR